MKSTLINALHNPEVYDHPVTDITVKETHTSWVILTGQFVYKIKKPVDFQFLDYTTLAKRKHFCEEECRLNQHLAPELYLGVVPIYGTTTQPQFNAAGEIIEYAVKMRQFDPQQQLDERLARSVVTDEDMDRIAIQLAAFHQQTAQADKTREFGRPEQIAAPVKQNFEQILPLIDDPLLKNKIQQIAAWSTTTHHRLQPCFQQRREQDHAIRECHGDFYGANITIYNDQIVFFDRIEFNEPFRFTDTIADVAFLFMDLLDKHHPDLAYRFLSTYLEQSQDSHGILVLLYYTVYRAMVRIKINIFRMQQEQAGSDEWQLAQQNVENLVKLTLKLIQPPAPHIIMMHGFSGSGKTYLSNHLLHLGMIRLRSDVLRKQLTTADLTTFAHPANTGIGTGLYTQAMTDKTYFAMAEKAHLVLTAGFPVIIDATFLQKKQRDRYVQLADELHIPWFIIDCRATQKVMEQRIQQRANQDDTSEATVDVLHYQENQREPLTEIEKQHTLIYERDDVESVMNHMRNHMRMQATRIE